MREGMGGPLLLRMFDTWQDKDDKGWILGLCERVSMCQTWLQPLWLDQMKVGGVVYERQTEVG